MDRLRFRMSGLAKGAAAVALAAATMAGCTAEEAPGVTVVQAEVKTNAPLRQVVLLGDSLAYGTGDESGKGIGGWLDDELKRRGAASRPSVNLGVDGATTRDVAARLRDEKVRTAIARADVVILSVGANDLARFPGAREEALREPFTAARRTLDRVASVVAAIREVNPDARILVLGGYNPFPQHSYAPLVARYLAVWDEALVEEFESDPRIAVVKMFDLVRGPGRLSSVDHFHPGQAAYRDAARRIARMLLG